MLARENLLVMENVMPKSLGIVFEEREANGMACHDVVMCMETVRFGKAFLLLKPFRQEKTPIRREILPTIVRFVRNRCKSLFDQDLRFCII